MMLQLGIGFCHVGCRVVGIAVLGCYNKKVLAEILCILSFEVYRFF